MIGVLIFLAWASGFLVTANIAQNYWRDEFGEPRDFFDFIEEKFWAALAGLIWPFFLVAYGSWRLREWSRAVREGE